MGQTAVTPFRFKKYRHFFRYLEHKQVQWWLNPPLSSDVNNSFCHQEILHLAKWTMGRGLGKTNLWIRCDCVFSRKSFWKFWYVGQGWNSFPFKEVWDARWKTLKSYKVDLVLSRVQHSPLIGWFPVAKIHISLQTTTWERMERRTWILEGMGSGKDIHPWEESIESVQPDSRSLMFILASFMPLTCGSCTTGKIWKCI